MFGFLYVYNASSLPYVTKLPGVALHDVIYRLCLTAAAFRDVTKNMVRWFAWRDVTWRDGESKMARVALCAVTQRLRCSVLRYVTWHRKHCSLRVTSCDAENAMRGVTLRDVTLKILCPVLRYMTWHGEHCGRWCLTYTCTENPWSNVTYGGHSVQRYIALRFCKLICYFNPQSIFSRIPETNSVDCWGSPFTQVSLVSRGFN